MATEKNKGGRPLIVLTDEQVAKVEEVAEHLTIKQIAGYFGFSERVFYEIKQRQEAVSASYKKGKAKGVLEVAYKLKSLIDQGDVSAIIFYLKTQGGWSTTSRNEDEPKFAVGNKTPKEIMDAGLDALARGEIGINEAQQIGNLALTTMNIANNTSPETQAVYHQRSIEEAKAFAKKIEKAMEQYQTMKEFEEFMAQKSDKAYSD
ncbi:hypothetical protein KC717_03775 [Candidatus Dojkabacteria bacterium]|uniref:Helix-turn-helix domain-containing protein n=1 Tax=Candidatus Dojkabacteria bacterium TaxID=2099670 RepID=A0A955L8N0_9BACT|nr:hypothetical protein [Candidatus Dojkabacteria bacterium]